MRSGKLDAPQEDRLANRWRASPRRAPGPRSPRYLSLSVKMLAVATLPVLLAGVLIALILTAQRTVAMNSVSHSLASSVARILATTLDVQDVALVTSQLQAAVSSQSVAFVDLRPSFPQLRFFVSKDQESNWYLRRDYDDFMAAHPGQNHFRFTDRRSAAYRSADAALGNLPEQADVRRHLRDDIRRYGSSEGAVSDFQVVTMRVYGTPGGARLLRFAGETPGQALPARSLLLFTLGIGVENEGLSLLMDRQLHLVLLACGLVALCAAVLAQFAARRLMRPILGVTRAAGRISLGDVDTPVVAQSNDEAGELAHSLERLRVSLQLALTRLRPTRELPGREL